MRTEGAALFEVSRLKTVATVASLQLRHSIVQNAEPRADGAKVKFIWHTGFDDLLKAKYYRGPNRRFQVLSRTAVRSAHMVSMISREAANSVRMNVELWEAWFLFTGSRRVLKLFRFWQFNLHKIERRTMTSTVQDIRLDRIRESTSNPRRTFDEGKLKELAENIKLHGVLQAILVRPAPDGTDGTYELVAGARRFRASKLAGRDTIPTTVRNLTDAECREIQLIENLQRADIHELDEGIGYRSLIEMKPDFYTVETIAAQVAKSPAYVKGRISLTDLISAAQTAFYEGKLTVAHARELARLQPADQEHALIECFPGHRSTASILKDRKAESMTIRQLRDWIEREIHLDLKNAPFDANDANLLPATGPCSTCLKRTGNNPLLFPEVRNKSVCTDPACYRAKLQALVKARLEPLLKEGQKPVQISSAPLLAGTSQVFRHSI